MTTNATASLPSYTVTRTASRVYDFSFPERRFTTMAEALSAAKGIAHQIRDIAPGTGGDLFPRVVDQNGYEVPYTILSY